jgi:hypothetical protein
MVDLRLILAEGCPRIAANQMMDLVSGPEFSISVLGGMLL